MKSDHRHCTSTDKTADRGSHEFTFAVYPHKGDARGSEVIKQGYSLNCPVKIAKVDTFDSVAVTDNEAVIIETVMSDGKGNVVLRLYESKGEKCETSLYAGFSYNAVKNVDFMLENPCDADIKKLSFTPFEIKTLLFER